MTLYRICANGHMISLGMHDSECPECLSHPVQKATKKRRKRAKGTKTPKQAGKRGKSALENEFAAFYKMLGKGLPSLTPEFRFHPLRRWRFDFALPDYKIAIEIEGGVYSGGRHTRAKGFIGDCDKYNTATVLGWRVLRYTSEHLKNPVAVIQQIRAMIELIAYSENAA